MAQTKRAAKKKAQRFSADAMAARLIGGLLLVAIGLLVFLSAAVSMRGSVFDLSRRVAFGLAGSLALPMSALLIWGGVVYSVGAAVYAIGSRKKYFHSIFHFFCLGGTVLHFLSIYLYVM